MKNFLLFIMVILINISLFSQNSIPPHRTCATMENHEHLMQTDENYKKSFEQMETTLQPYLQNNQKTTPVVTIPVVVHIVHNGDAIGNGENITDNQVISQITALNQDFQALNADFSNVPSVFTSVAADAEIAFCLAQQDPNGQPTNGILRHNLGQTSWTQSTCNSTMKPGTIWDRNKYLNIWVVRFGGSDASTLGYAQFPGGPANTDGVVIGYQYFGTIGTAQSPFNKGRTATHEIGHWLNLRHIGGDQSGGCGDDLVSDTPPQKGGSVFNGTGNGYGQNYGCPSHPLSYAGECTGTTAEMFMNYMDYVNDACMNMFTTGQRNRMQASISAFRINLTTSPGCNAPAAAPVADFVANQTSIPPGTAVTFTDLSTNSPAIWQWSISPSTGWSFTTGNNLSQNPVITFNTVGAYTISLKATNSIGSDSISKTNYINVQNCSSLNVDVLTDNYGYETYWKITDDANGNIMLDGGNTVVPPGGGQNASPSDPGAYSDNTSYNSSVCLPNGCYTFTIYDAFGDGICCSYGNGSYTIDSMGTTLTTGGTFNTSTTYSFCINNNITSSLGDINFNSFKVYPNPAKNKLFIQSENEIIDFIEILDAMGRLIETEIINDFEKEINVEQLQNGLYFIKAQSNTKQGISKVIIRK